jgi:hypothetical protein
MKKPLLTVLLCFAVASPLAMAQSKDEHSTHHPQAPAAAGAKAPPQGAPADAQPGPSPVDQGMKRLRDLMTQIEQSSDPAQREMLLHEHMIAMLEQIKLLRSQTEGMNMAMMMMGGTDGGGRQMGMMGGDKKKGGSKSGKKDKSGGTMCSEMMGDGTMGAGMMGMHTMMEKRLSMVEQLLEQSIEHAHMREAAEH